MLTPALVLGSDLPVSSLIPMAEAVRRDFASIHQFREINLSGHPDGPTDLVVSGKRFKDHGWHVEVFRKDRGQLVPRWDSEQFTQSAEFKEIRPPRIRVWNFGHDYGVLLEGCAAHKCSHGSRGYLWFSGSTGSMGQASVAAQAGGNSSAAPEVYKVEFAPSVDEDSRQALQEAMCSDTAIRDKSGLPFTCTAHWKQRGRP
jgi:hypothetical protein